MNNDIQSIIAHRTISTILSNGWTISVHDGEEWTVKRSAAMNVIKSALNTTEDADTLRVRDADNNIVGSIVFVWQGNDCNPEDVFYNYTDSMDIIVDCVIDSFNK